MALSVLCKDIIILKGYKYNLKTINKKVITII